MPQTTEQRASTRTPPIGTFTVLIAARNEADAISATVESALALRPAPREVLVVVNNTSDDTAARARQAGAEVLEMTENRHKKAGALNYGLQRLEPTLSDAHAIVIMDADTVLESRFAEVAIGELDANPQAGAVGSIFTGRDTDSLIGRMQQMEYFRYRREIKQRGNQALVLSGTAAMIRWSALQSVRQARLDGDVIPRGDSYYDTVSLTEDNELTFALKTLGWECPAPDVTSTTDVMETPLALYRQRHRWYIGALQNIWHYGRMMPWHLRWVYWGQQIGLFASIVMLAVIVGTNVLSAAVFGIAPGWSIFTAIVLAVLLLHLLERTATVWAMGPQYRLIALAYFPELLYSLLLLFVYGRALIDHTRGRSGTWHAT